MPFWLATGFKLLEAAMFQGYLRGSSLSQIKTRFNNGRGFDQQSTSATISFYYKLIYKNYILPDGKVKVNKITLFIGEGENNVSS